MMSVAMIPVIFQFFINVHYIELGVQKEKDNHTFPIVARASYALDIEPHLDASGREDHDEKIFHAVFAGNAT